MRISKADFDGRVNSFLLELVSTLPASHHKFMAGMLIGSMSQAISNYTATLVGEDDLVDLEVVKATLAKGFEASGGELKLQPSDLIPNELVKQLFAGIVTTIRPEDIEKYLN